MRRKVKISELKSHPKNNLYMEFERKGTTIKYINPLFALSKEEYKVDMERLASELWNGYKKGFVRTACWCCPFQKREQWKAMKIYYPLLWGV